MSALARAPEIVAARYRLLTSAPRCLRWSPMTFVAVIAAWVMLVKRASSRFKRSPSLSSISRTPCSWRITRSISSTDAAATRRTSAFRSSASESTVASPPLSLRYRGGDAKFSVTASSMLASISRTLSRFIDISPGHNRGTAYDYFTFLLLSNLKTNTSP
jgi:hypothetical protein